MAEGCGSGWAGEGRRPRILVVEDDGTVAEVVREVAVRRLLAECLRYPGTPGFRQPDCGKSTGVGMMGG